MTDYQTVVEKMLEALRNDENDYSRRQMMSTAESAHGERISREHREYLEHLIRTTVLEDGV